MVKGVFPSHHFSSWPGLCRLQEMERWLWFSPFILMMSTDKYICSTVLITPTEVNGESHVHTDQAGDRSSVMGIPL